MNSQIRNGFIALTGLSGFLSVKCSVLESLGAGDDKLARVPSVGRQLGVYFITARQSALMFQVKSSTAHKQKQNSNDPCCLSWSKISGHRLYHSD